MGIGGAVKAALSRTLPSVVLVRGAPGPEPRVALTFDDGPHRDHTPAILDILAARGAKATFFLQGSLAERHPDLVRAIAAGGHQVANHGWSHARASDVGTRAFVREALATQALLENTLGRPLSRLYRPPYGAISPLPFLALARRGYRLVFWSLDSQDSFRQDSEGLVKALEDSMVHSGEILLFHEDYSHTARALPGVLQVLTARGFSFVTVGDL